MDPVLVLAGAGVLIAIVLVVGTGILIGVVRRQNAQRQLDRDRSRAAELEQLSTRAGSALVRTDERLRLAGDDAGFAAAEFGDTATADFRTALHDAHARLAEAFHLNQLLHDHIADTDAQRQEWMSRIVSLCDAADQLVGAQQAAVASRRSTARRTPSEIERVQSEVQRLRALLPHARSTLEELGRRYSVPALAPIADNPEQAERLLEFAERSARVAGSRAASSRADEADAAVRAALETTGRAQALLTAVDGFEVEAIRAEATLQAMIDESRLELDAARAIPSADRRERIDPAIADLAAALAALPAVGEPLDPVGSLTAVRRANTALDEAVAERAARAERADRARSQLATAVQDAEQQILAARSLLADYSSPAGPDARTRLAEAERVLAESSEERDAERAVAGARRAASLAAEAASLAHAGRYGAGADTPGGYGEDRYGTGGGYSGGGYGTGVGGVLGDLAGRYGSSRGSRGGRRGGRGGGLGGGDMIGGIIGGLAIGGLLDGMGDLGDLFDD